MRIVKADAKELTVVQVEGDKIFLKSDTIKIKPGWRPDNIGEIRHRICKLTGSCTEGDCESCSQVPNFNETWDACIEAMEKEINSNEYI